MKKLVLASLFLVLVVFCVSSQERRTVTIVNNTGYTIFNLYTKPPERPNWSADLLGTNVIQNGGSYNIFVTYDYADICLVDADGDTYTKYFEDTYGGERIVFTIRDLD